MSDIVLAKKVCPKCKSEKTELDFYPNASKPDNLSTWCKECMKAEKRDWYKYNREVQKVRVRKGKEEIKQGVDPTYGKHACKGCGKSEPEVVFNLRKSGGRYYKRHLCTVCYREYKRGQPNKNKHSPENKRRQGLRAKIRRQNPEFSANHILGDSRTSDRSKGRGNDLDLEFVRELTKNNLCAYCGETNLRITLDRIDNALGHLKTNVIAACIRCNGIRCNMPFEAWRHIVPKIRSAQRNGLFGDWQGRKILRIKDEHIPLDGTFWHPVDKV